RGEAFLPSTVGPAADDLDQIALVPGRKGPEAHGSAGRARTELREDAVIGADPPRYVFAELLGWPELGESLDLPFRKPAHDLLAGQSRDAELHLGLGQDAAAVTVAAARHALGCHGSIRVGRHLPVAGIAEAEHVVAVDILGRARRTDKGD